ncbi:MAG: rhomboid family intramembrane serine protease [Halorhabdus sp.]
MSRESPTTTLIGLMVVIALLQGVLWVFSVPVSLALAWPLTDAPWTLLSSVLAHGGPFHLATNAVGLFVLGLVLERQTSAWRFYAFFLGVGAIAGATEVTVMHVLGDGVSVLGASGAIFGLLGYLLAGNRLTDAVADRVTVSPRAAIVATVGVALVITWLTRGRRVALIAHFTGLVVGLLAGRAHLLRNSDATTAPRDGDRPRP